MGDEMLLSYPVWVTKCFGEMVTLFPRHPTLAVILRPVPNGDYVYLWCLQTIHLPVCRYNLLYIH